MGVKARHNGWFRSAPARRRAWELEARTWRQMPMSQPKTLQQTLPGLWRITRYFWPHLRNYRGLMAGSFAALLAEVSLRLLEPWPLKFVFDHIIGQRHTPRKPLPAFLLNLDPITLLTGAACAVLVITCLRAIASYW